MGPGGRERDPESRRGAILAPEGAGDGTDRIGGNASARVRSRLAARRHASSARRGVAAALPFVRHDRGRCRDTLLDLLAGCRIHRRTALRCLRNAPLRGIRHRCPVVRLVSRPASAMASRSRGVSLQRRRPCLGPGLQARRPSRCGPDARPLAGPSGSGTLVRCRYDRTGSAAPTSPVHSALQSIRGVGIGCRQGGGSAGRGGCVGARASDAHAGRARSPCPCRECARRHRRSPPTANQGAPDRRHRRCPDHRRDRRCLRQCAAQGRGGFCRYTGARAGDAGGIAPCLLPPFVLYKFLQIPHVLN